VALPCVGHLIHTVVLLFNCLSLFILWFSFLMWIIKQIHKYILETVQNMDIVSMEG